MDVKGLERRELGGTGVRVSAIGLGTVKLGRNEGVKYPSAFEIPDDAAAARLLDRAGELGINLLDTAPAYGTSEERLGRLLADGAGGGRAEWVLCTKAGESFEGGGVGSRFDFSSAAITASVERSLRRLRTDAVDVVLLHSDGRDAWLVRESGAVEALERLRREGKCRAIGVSTKSVEGGLAAVERLREGGGGAVMVTFNAGATAEGAVIDAARAAGVGVLVKKALESGQSEEPGAALRFAVARAGVSSVVVGTISPEHLEANVRAVVGSAEPPP